MREIWPVAGEIYIFTLYNMFQQFALYIYTQAPNLAMEFVPCGDVHYSRTPLLRPPFGLAICGRNRGVAVIQAL